MGFWRCGSGLGRRRFWTWSRGNLSRRFGDGLDSKGLCAFRAFCLAAGVCVARVELHPAMGALGFHSINPSLSTPSCLNDAVHHAHLCYQRNPSISITYFSADWRFFFCSPCSLPPFFGACCSWAESIYGVAAFCYNVKFGLLGVFVKALPG